MKRLSIVLSFSLWGCGLGGGQLTAAESALVNENEEITEAEEDIEVGVEDSLAGGMPAQASASADPNASMADAEMAVRTNPGLFFRPAGCIVSTAAANVVTHVFTNCTGPRGRTYNGTITSTWAFATGTLTVVHAATDFLISKAKVSGSVTVTYTRSGSQWTRTRVGAWTGLTQAGTAIAHNANFTATYDTSTNCISRSGSSTTTLGTKTITRTLADYERCGIGRLGCPNSGTITVSNGTLTLTVDFTADGNVIVTRPNGRMITRALVCIPQSS